MVVKTVSETLFTNRIGVRNQIVHNFCHITYPNIERKTFKVPNFHNFESLNLKKIKKQTFYSVI